MSKLLEFLATSLGRWVGIGAAIAFVVGGFAWQQQSVGKRKERIRIEKQDRKHVSNADKAAAASRDPRARGVLDPYRRHD